MWPSRATKEEITISTKRKIRAERNLDYFREKRLKTNLKHVQPDDELGMHRAEVLSDFEAQLWFDLVYWTVERDQYMSRSAYKDYLECLKTGGADIAVGGIASRLGAVLAEAVKAVAEWFPEFW